MKKLTSALERLFSVLENGQFSLFLGALAFFCIIAARLTLDLGIEKFPAITFFQFFFQWTHLLLFFLFSYLLLLPLVMAAAQTSLAKAARVLLFGFLVLLLPPIIDKLIFGDSLYWSFYIFDSLANMPERFVTFFGDKPHLGITYGVRVEVALVLLGIFLYGFVKTKLLGRTLLYTLLAYVLLFILGTLPSWFSYLLLSPYTPILSITDTHIAELFLSPEMLLGRNVADLKSALAYKMSLLLLLGIATLTMGIWYRARTQEWKACLQNVRWPQVFYHNGLLFLGMGLALIYTGVSLPHNIFSYAALLVLCLAVTTAWLASVVWNDLYDQLIDAKTNAFRPLITGAVTPSQYQTYGLLLFIFSFLSGALVSFQAALLLIAYQALATLYSVPPLRLKRFFGIATLTASCAAILILIIGYLALHPNHSLQDLPVHLLFYLTLVYSLMLPLKDFKDVAGDKKDKVHTLPVILGTERAKVVMSAITFLIFMSSIFILHAPQLLLWAFLFGSLSFWLIQGAGTPKSRISYRALSTVFIVLALVYGFGVALFLL